MLNRFLNRMLEPEKGQASSPPTSPNRGLNESREDAEATAAEGFLCPSCMKKFLTSDALQTHYFQAHGDGEIYTCDLCNVQFTSVELLQLHGNAEHGTAKKGDLVSLKHEVDELRTSLKEERWNSEELKKEVLRLCEKNEVPQEVELLRIQLKAMEESKSLLSSEVVLLRNQLAEAVDTNTSLKHQKEAIENKAAALAEEHVAVKCKLDEENSNVTVLMAKLKESEELRFNLEAQLQQRPEADDVRVLRQELIQVQTLMDRITREREEEKESLRQEYQALQMQYVKVVTKNDDLEQELNQAPKLEDLDRIKSQLMEAVYNSEHAKEELNVKEDKLQAVNQHIIELRESISAKEDAIYSITSEKGLLEQKLAVMVADLQSAKHTHEENMNNCSNLKGQLHEVELALNSKETEVDCLQKKISELLTSTSEKFGSQEEQITEMKLQLEKDALTIRERESQLENVEQQLSIVQTHYQEQGLSVDELKSQLWEIQSQFSEEKRHSEVRESKVEELEQMLLEHKSTLTRLETERAELYAKMEDGEGANTAIQQLQMENATLMEKLLHQQRSAENQSEENEKKLDQLHQQLKEARAQLQSVIAKNEKLDANLKELSDELNVSRTKIGQLDLEVKGKAELLLAAEATRVSQKTEFERVMLSTQASLNEKVQTLDETKAKLAQTLSDLVTKNEISIKMESELKEERRTCHDLNKEIESLHMKVVDMEENLALRLSELGIMKQVLSDVNESKSQLVADSIQNEKIAQIKLEEIEEAKKQLEEKHHLLLKKYEELEKDTKATDNKLKDAEAAHAEKLVDITNEMQALMSERASLEEKLEKTSEANSEAVEVLRQEIKKLTVLLECSKSALMEKLKESEDLLVKVADLEESNTALYKEIDDLKSLTAAIQDGKREAEEALGVCQKDVASKVSSLSKIRSELESTNAAFQQCQLDCGNFTDDLNQLRKTHEETVSKLRDVEKHLRETQSLLADTQCTLELRLNELEASRSHEKQLSQSLQDSQQCQAELTSQVDEMFAQLSTAMADIQSLNLQKTSLETEIFNSQKDLTDLEEKHSTLEQKLKEHEQRFAEEKSAYNKELALLCEAKELLILQKTDLQNKLENLEKTFAQKFADLQQIHEITQKQLLDTRTQLEDSQKALTAIAEAKANVDREFEQSRACDAMQLSTLNENLSTLRSDLVFQQERAELLEKKVDDLSSDKLELSAKLENAVDERRAFLERCLTSEGECEKLRVVTTELRRKLDDSMSALHELGRENQTLQIETTKHLNRKWAQDAETLNCMACQKPFSVMNRRHHCRNCGNIFCQECSAKSTTVASSKKPVRVCDNCYNELSKY